MSRDTGDDDIFFKAGRTLSKRKVLLFLGAVALLAGAAVVFLHFNAPVERYGQARGLLGWRWGEDKFLGYGLAFLIGGALIALAGQLFGKDSLGRQAKRHPVSSRRLVPCPDCNAEGKLSATGSSSGRKGCPTCGGDGWLSEATE